MNIGKIGLVLEGGGARGAYQAGAIVMLGEMGYIFDAVVGTSIGALNGSMYAQKTFDKSYDLWNSLNYQEVFGFDDNYAMNVVSKSMDIDTIAYLMRKITEALANKGVDTSGLRNIVKTYIDEDKLRGSDIEFGVMTVSLTDMKPCPIFLDEIPKGMVAEYVMASASLPIFDRTVINDKSYLDGGFYDNMPINMLIDKGYKDIVAIETMSKMRKVKCKDDRAQVLYIKPAEKPGRMLDFSTKSIAHAINMGKHDVIKYLGGYIGEKYYLDVSSVSPFGYGLCDMKYDDYVQIANLFELKKISKTKSILLKELTAELSRRYKKSFKNIADAMIFFLETMAIVIELDEMVYYDIRLFVRLLANNTSQLYTKRATSYYEKLFERLNQRLNLSQKLPDIIWEKLPDKYASQRKCEQLIGIINKFYNGD